MRNRVYALSVLLAAALATGISLFPQASRMPDASETMAATLQLTNSPDEQDFPAIAQSSDTVYVTYVEFVHSDRARESSKQLTAEPKSFDYLARPAGGDRVFLLSYAKNTRTWSPPVPVSAAGQDIMRTAVAVDGKQRVWVFWSARRDGNFDIYARFLSGSRWSNEVRISADAGTDVNPVAATDASGRIWLAWQGFRNGSLEVLAAAQDGDRFSRESAVSISRASDWDPAIATAPNGEVAVSWDTYDKGDYDVYFRRLKWDGSIRMETPVAAAATRNFEARTSIAYDSRSRLWLAYEVSTAKWGKDFGAYETTGVSLYQNHTVEVKCFQGAQALTTASSLQETVPRLSPPMISNNGKELPEEKRTLPDPNAIKGRLPNQTVRLTAGPLNSFPRIAADPNGTIYLAYRTPLSGKSPLGGVWAEQLVSFDGDKWNGPLTVPDSENFNDERAAMAVVAPGDLLMIVTTDHRQPRAPTGESRKAKGRKKQPQPASPADGGANSAINTDLYAAEYHFKPPQTSARLTPLPAPRAASADPEAVLEARQIELMRNYRTAAGGAKLQLLRGEFHRHTEVSGDGGRDGPLIDAYRYMIDAASMDWGGCCDHDNGAGREYSWWTEQKLTDAYHLSGRYVPMFSYERSVGYPEGHRNIVTAQRGVRPLPRMPISAIDQPGPAPDTQMLYRYLKRFDAIVASHTSATNMGTDWRDNDSLLEPVVEIYQGDRQNYEMPGAPKSNTKEDSIGNWRPQGFVSMALQKGYRLGFQASSDHTSTHMSYCNLWVSAPTREGIMDALRKRRVYGATDNILADVHCGSHFMGEEFTVSEPPAISVMLRGTDRFAKVHIIKDGQYVYTTEPKAQNVDFVWKDNAATKGKTCYYYVRGEQADGELVWVSPMWITYR